MATLRFQDGHLLNAKGRLECDAIGDSPTISMPCKDDWTFKKRFWQIGTMSDCVHSGRHRAMMQDR